MVAVADLQDIKKEKILEAAYNRFLHYGYSKTTMNEIAGDLSMSKALLYYYFPDKSQLYIDVMRKVGNEYLNLYAEKEHTFCNLKEAFEFQINTQHEFMLKNYNLFDFFRLNEQNLPDAIWEIAEHVHEGEKKILINAIAADTPKCNIKPMGNVGDLVDLLLDALHGVSVTAKSHKKTMFPVKEDLEEIRKKRLLLSEIFIRGLTK
ncbi:MAG TPA: TetR/AcrR family transcriptional regulator [Mucilaginibacter sp.]|jgi:TetR/AcrR family transcriptional repressor of mexJK operon|nr:TetR/AcrR family transcriptional regulator [Mucilaginibacter sp.]